MFRAVEMVYSIILMVGFGALLLEFLYFFGTIQPYYARTSIIFTFFTRKAYS